ncbi:DUF359 domain-containing protein [Methanonatronarchaeum sp. AMET-Sl]|uniref:GTP-dependent dephospho-CoA kinase family protein n=1 Tax=Methanonatronarchaeum sp. AMET-Sl TaxID=3037654 RepID=UPI00244DB476|nr:DUF359 domain-containing protein [Methanonatronarchaeum sp. AMET-Sl]WGI16988.1 DUF359 domain-containing protein [Methanonatronarchaeum sp. AMET-Sl]
MQEPLRSKLKKPLGTLIKDGEESVEKVLEDYSSKEIVSVGDVTTYNLLKQKIYPTLAIVDGRVMREEASQDIKNEIGQWSYQIKEVSNPAGHITTELVKAIKDGFDIEEPYLISVDGEEDLAVLPAVLHAPEGYIILYGQPKEGLVSVTVDRDCKDKVKNYLDMMEEI